jgi:hypothetical protein
VPEIAEGGNEVADRPLGPSIDKPVGPRTEPRTGRAWLALVLGLAAIALFSGLLVLGITDSGMKGAPPDTVVYLSTAAELRDGHGYTTPFDTLFDHFGPAAVAKFDGHVPLVAWSPLYPTALAGVEAVFGTSGFDAARAINICAQMLTVVLGGAIVYQITRSRLRALLVAGVLALLPGLLVSSTFALSDAFFIPLALGALLAVRWYVEHPRPLRLVLVAVLALLVVATRLEGIAVPVAIGAAMLVAAGAQWKHRMLAAVGVIAPSLLFVVLWTRRDTGGSRAYHAPTMDDLRAATATFTGWIATGAPTHLRVVAVVIVGLLLVTAAIVVWRTILPEPARALLLAVGLWTLGTLLVIVFTRTFFNAGVSFNSRLALPVEVGLVVLLGCAQTTRSRVAERALTAALIVVAVVAVFPWADRGAWREGFVAGRPTTAGALGQSTVSRPEPAISRAVRKLEGKTIVSDYPENVWTDTGRSAIRLPSKIDVTADRANADFAADMRSLHTILRPGDHIVLYQRDADPHWSPTLEEIEAAVPVSVVYAAPDGYILRVN